MNTTSPGMELRKAARNIAAATLALLLATGCDRPSPSSDNTPVLTSPPSASPSPPPASSEETTNLVAELAHLEQLHAEAAFAEGDTRLGLAWLARVVRRDPDNRTAARRLIFALTYRSFAIPAAPPLPHPAKINCAKLSPDGKLVASGATDGIVRLWNLDEPMPGSSAIPTTSPILALAFSPDGSRILAGCQDGEARMLQRPFKNAQVALGGHEKPVFHVEFDSTGGRALIAADDATVSIWDTSAVKLLSRFATHEAPLQAARFSPDGARVLSADVRGVAFLWHADTGTVDIGPMSFSAPISDARFGPDGRRLALAFEDGAIRILDALSGRMVAEPAAPDFPISALAWSPDGARLAIATEEDEGGSILLLDAFSGKSIAGPLPVSYTPRRLIFSPGGLRLASASYTGAIEIRDALDLAPLTEPVDADAPVRVLEFSPDGARLLTNAGERALQQHDIRLGNALPRQFQSDATIVDAVFSPGGSRVAAADENGKARLWNFEQKTALWISEPQTNSIVSLAFSEDKKLLRLGLENGLTSTLLTASGETTEGADFTPAAAVGDSPPDFQRAVALSAEGAPQLWDTEAELPLTPELPLAEGRRIVRLHPARDAVLVAGDGPVARVWELPAIDSPTPAWLPDLAEALAGGSLDARHEFIPLGIGSRHAGMERARAARETGDNSFARFARWFFADRVGRSIAPGNSLATTERISEWKKYTRLGDLREAALRAPGAPEIWASIASYLFESSRAFSGDDPFSNARFLARHANRLNGSPFPQLESLLNATTAASSPQQEAAPEPPPATFPALLFDGDSSRITAANIPFDEYPTFTIEAWVKAWTGHLMSQGTQQDLENGLWLAVGSRDETRASGWPSGWESGIDKTFARVIAAESKDEWTHVALSFDGANLLLHVNGRLKHRVAAPSPGPLHKDRPLLIGAHAWPDRLTFGSGALHSLRISRIQRHRGDFLPDGALRADRHTVLLYDFSINPGRDAQDRSGSERHGVIHNAAWSPGF